MEEWTWEHWNLYYLFLWDRQENPMPQQAKRLLAKALFGDEDDPANTDWREKWKEKN